MCRCSSLFLKQSSDDKDTMDALGSTEAVCLQSAAKEPSRERERAVLTESSAGRGREERAFLGDFLQSHAASGAQGATVEYLQQIARTRLCLDLSASLLVDSLDVTGTSSSGMWDHMSSIL